MTLKQTFHFGLKQILQRFPDLLIEMNYVAVGVISTAVILQVEIANLTVVVGFIGNVPSTIPSPVCSTLKSAAIEPLLAKRLTVDPINASNNCLIGRSRHSHSHPTSTGGSNVIGGPGGKKLPLLHQKY